MSEELEPKEVTPEEPVAANPEPIKEAVTKAPTVNLKKVLDRQATAVSSARTTYGIDRRAQCVCCGGVMTDDGCALCGTTATTAPTIDGTSFADLFASAKSGDEFTYPGPYRSGRDREALERHGTQSVFSHGGIVAAAVQAGFIVLAHSPNVIFKKS